MKIFIKINTKKYVFANLQNCNKIFSGKKVSTVYLFVEILLLTKIFSAEPIVIFLFDIFYQLNLYLNNPNKKVLYDKLKIF